MYLGIDTSNYKTSVALYDPQNGFYVNETQLLHTPKGKIGLRQSEALFQHVNQLPEILKRLPSGIGRSLTAIGVSTRPRSLEGSYMPCFLAGQRLAESMAHLLNLPLYTFSHQQGHIAAALFSAKHLNLLEQEFLAWHLSGGTTELIHVTPDQKEIFRTEILGGTNDLAAGQIIDRAGKLLNLPFPAGPYMEQLADTCAEEMEGFSPKVKNMIFSLSGVENKIQNLLREDREPAYIAKFTLKTILHAIEKTTEEAKSKYSLPLICSGGVMSNRILQTYMKNRYFALIAEPSLSGDNAVGIAILASVQNQKEVT